ncbi:MAG: formylglycine-generating enzyme family protein, partial [Myxococcota bacterium]|nr:formylglycine-generating enzyme family protein [Myxococcota bacterium]
MTKHRSTTLVVFVAAATGVVLARGAGAVGTSTTARDDSEHEEGHTPSSGDNPYDEVEQVRGVPQRQVVPQQGGMLRLPGGRFMMGSGNPRAPINERPAHALTLEPFWIDRTEVTVGAYRACVTAAACPAPARASAACTFESGDPELPVSCVHWRDADTYCR